MTANMDTSTWTYGAEHEWADWPLARRLPPGYGRDVRDITIVNSTGVANDPTGKLHGFGGEINTPPTDTPDGQVACLLELKALLPEATVNYRSNLHLHIRVPGLKDDLTALKQVQRRIHEWMPLALPIIEPLAIDQVDPRAPGSAEGLKRRLRRMKVSHQTLLRPERVQRQLDAPTVEAFFEAEVPRSKAGAVMWHAQPRLSVNLRQLRETDTVEFRHWPGTMDPDELAWAFQWCRGFMMRALLEESEIKAHLATFEELQRDGKLPRFKPYDHWLEERYRRTVHDGTIPRDQLPINIANVLKETRP